MSLLVDQLTRCSIYGSVLIAAVFVLRFFLRKQSKRWVSLLWLVVLLRLAVPFEINTSFSLQPQIARSDSQIIPVRSQYITDSQTDIPIPSIADLNADGELTQMKADTTVCFPWIWLLGFTTILLYGLIANLRLRYRCRNAVIYEEGVWLCPGLESSFVLGLFRHRIYLDANVAAEYIPSVLCHERTHIRRGDQWWKLIGFVVLAAHWFNPLVWAAYSCACKDIEMACDEAVTCNMDNSQRKKYCQALLSCAVHPQSVLADPVAFGEISVKERIVNLMHYKKPKFWLIAVICLVFAVLCVFLLTSPKNLTDDEILSACYQQIAQLQSQDEITITIHTQFECDDDYYISRSQTFHKDGDTWYRVIETVTEDGTVTTCYLQTESSVYACEYSRDIPNFNNRDWEVLDENTSIGLYLLENDFTQLEVLEIRREEAIDGSAYTVVLQGDMEPDAPKEEYYVKRWEFYLDADGKLLGNSLYTSGTVYYSDISNTSGGYHEMAATDSVSFYELDKDVLAAALAEIEEKYQQQP